MDGLLILTLTTWLRAYFGNQQFTTSHLVFVRCNTAVQVHWDWAWTMHDYVIESCNTGLMIIGGVSLQFYFFLLDDKDLI